MKNSTTPEEKARKAFNKRVFAGLIDLTLWVILFIVAAVNFGTTTKTVQGSATNTNIALSGTPFYIFLLAGLAYFVFLEWRLGGTLGKLLLGVRVIDAKGGPLTLRQSILRNILRIVDAFPYIVPYLTGLIIMAGDERKRRTGDRVAHTLVILGENTKN